MNYGSTEEAAEDLHYCVKCEMPMAIVLAGLLKSGTVEKQYACMNCMYTRKR